MSGKPPKHDLSSREELAEVRASAQDQLQKAEAEATRLEEKAKDEEAKAKLRPAFRAIAMTTRAEAAQARGKVETLRNQLHAEEEEIEAEIAHVKKVGIANAFSSRRKTTVRLPMNGKGTRRNKSSGGDIVTHLLTIRNQVKLYHWQTGSFARHKATDDLTATLDTLIDSFVESYMGRYGRPKVSGSIPLHNFSESAAKSFVAQQTTYLSSVLPKKIKSTDTDLLNIRDEILGELNKVLYLFTLA